MIRGFSTAIMTDPVFRKRSEAARLLYFTLYMHPANHMCGLFSLTVEHMAVDLGMGLKKTQDALDELVNHALVQCDRDLDLVWIPEMAARVGDVSKPDNQVGKSIIKYLMGLRPSALIKKLSDTLSIPYRYPIDTLCHRVLTVSGSDSVTDSGSGSGSGSGSETPNVGQAKPGPLQVEPPKVTRPVRTGKSAAGNQLIASTLLGELSAARKRCKVTARNLDPVAENLEQFQGRLAEGRTPDDIRHVIAVLEERVKVGDYNFDYFNPVSPFRKTNFMGHLAKDIKAAAPQRAPPAGRPDTITSSSTTEARVLNSRESLEKHLGIKVSERIVDGARSESDTGDASDF